MIKADLKLDRRFLKKLQGRYERFNVKAGVLDDKPHRAPRGKTKGLGTLQGGPVRKMKHDAPNMVSDVSERIRKDHNVNYLRDPITKPRSKEMVAFRRAMLELLSGAAKSYSKVETALRAVIRVPILKQRYGRNTRKAARVKGFNRKLFDTGQFFKAIVAKVRSGRVSKRS